MAKITNISLLQIEQQPIPKYKIWVTTNYYDKKRHRIILRVNNSFYDLNPNSLEIDINIFATNPNNVNVNKVLRIYAQLFDYLDDKIIYTKVIEYKYYIPLQKYIKVEPEILTTSDAFMANYWTKGKLVASISGPYDTNGQIVSKIKMGEIYLYRAIPNQELKPTELLAIQWAYKYDNEKIKKFKHQEELFVQNSNVAYCSFPKKDNPKNITVYAYFVKESEKVAIKTEVFISEVLNKATDPIEVENTINDNKVFTITEVFLDKFMSRTKHGSINKKEPYNKRIPAYIDYLNLYMEKFGLKENNFRIAHFLGQVAKETKFWSYKEDFIYKKSSLQSTFKNFNTYEGKEKANELGYVNDKKEVTQEMEIQVGNYAYGTGDKATELGNMICTNDKLIDDNQDGYKYHGRGLIQITGKNNYNQFQNWYNDKYKELQLEEIDFINKPNAVLEPKYIVLSAIYFWDKNNLNKLADKGIEKRHILEVSNVINSREDNDKKVIRREYVQAAYEELENHNYIDANGVITYHIYSNGKIEKHIPDQIKVKNKISYFYHTKLNKKHFIGLFKIKEIINIYGGKYGDSKVNLVDIRELVNYNFED